MSAEPITKQNINSILKDLGKEYRRLGGKHMPAEIVMTGGAAIVAKYGFRNTSYDLDAIIRAASCMKDASNFVRDRYNLEHNWLNSDFKNTSSYSNKLYQHSHYYRKFSNSLEIRIVDPEYLVATKLRSARRYKHDLSDIAGIITEEREINPDFTEQTILNAYTDMYGKNAEIDTHARQCMEQAFTTKNPAALLKNIQQSEIESNQALKAFEIQYPNVLNDENINQIADSIVKPKSINTGELQRKLQERARQEDRKKYADHPSLKPKEQSPEDRLENTDKPVDKDITTTYPH